jgi:hypothetical protein
VEVKHFWQRSAAWWQRHPQLRSMPHAATLAVALILAIGFAWFWRGLAGLAILAGVALAASLVLWVVPDLLVPAVPEEELKRVAEGKDRLEVADARLGRRNELRNGMLQTLEW